jgi:arylsulfatase A-like enzyme
MPDQMTAAALEPGGAIMPAAERLRREGICFSNTYTVSPHCCPARASFFTGHLPSRHGVWNNIDGPMAFSTDLKPGISTFCQALQQAGYRMAFAGKWHVSKVQSPQSLGWQAFKPADPPSLPRPSVAPVDAPRGEAPQQDPAGFLPREGWSGQTRMFSTLEASYGQGMYGWAPIQSAVSAIREFSRSDAPWCVFVSPDPPHDPYNAPANYVDLYRDARLPASFEDDLSDKPRVLHRQRRQLWDRMGRAGALACRRHYLGACSLVDDWLGVLLRELDDSGQTDNTLVVFTADHGDYAGAHGLWCKGIASFREAYAVPGIVRWPAGIASPGRRVDELVSLADFMPTFLELAGAPPAQGIFGQSLAPFLQGRTPTDWRDVLISQYNGAELYYTQRAVWDKDWKYVFNGFDYDELYDLRNDPQEMINLAAPLRQGAPGGGGAVALPEPLEQVRRRLMRRLWQIMEQHGDRYLSNSYWPMALAPYGPGIAKQ